MHDGDKIVTQQTTINEGSVDGRGRTPDQAPTITRGAVLAGGKTPDVAPVAPANGQTPSETGEF